MAKATTKLLAVSVGNTRTQFGVFQEGDLVSGKTVGNSSAAALIDALAEAAKELQGADRAAILVATVNPKLSREVVDALSKRLEMKVHEIGADMPIPIERATEEHAKTGQDRLLAAAAAFEIAGQACIVIDAGTAVTVDFVDGVGVFQGGAIAPGGRMMLGALHDKTAALPSIDLARPDDPSPFGKTTEQAMLNGVFYGIRGMVRMLAERYAEAYGAYPQVIATGGDARLLFEGDEFVEHVADDLVLRGIALAFRAATSDEGHTVGERRAARSPASDLSQ